MEWLEERITRGESPRRYVVGRGEIIMDISRIAGIEPSTMKMEAIDLHRGPYCMSYGFDLKPLIESIKGVGLINPPLLRRNERGGVDVVTGHRRCLAVAQLGYEELAVRVLEGTRFSPLECLLLSMYDNLPARRFNEVEKCMLLDRLALYLPAGEVVESYMPLLGLPSRKETFHLYRRMETELDEKGKDALAKGLITTRTVKTLMSLPGSGQAVLRAVEACGLNANQQRLFLELLSDLSHIDRKSVSHLLEEDEIRRILADPRLNRPQKAKAILRCLREKRFPTLARAERDFKAAVADLGLPHGVRIEPPVFFEDPNYRLEVRFKEGKELMEKIGELSEIESLPDFRNPWERGQ